MNAEVKQAWLAALRSGEYQQAHSRLHDTDEGGNVRHCCLGVLCDLHSKATGMPWKDEIMVTSYHGAYEFLPSDVRVWAELDGDSPVIQGHPLIAWNDGHDLGLGQAIRPHTFPEIADLIEQYL